MVNFTRSQNHLEKQYTCIHTRVYPTSKSAQRNFSQETFLANSTSHSA